MARLNYRNVNTDEEQIDNQFIDLWKTFMNKIQEAVEYISIQSPNILEQLNGLYNVIFFRIYFSYYKQSNLKFLKKYTTELKQIHLTGTTGKYTDPFENSTQILEDLKTVIITLLKPFYDLFLINQTKSYAMISKQWKRF